MQCNAKNNAPCKKQTIIIFFTFFKLKKKKLFLMDMFQKLCQQLQLERFHFYRWLPELAQKLCQCSGGGVGKVRKGVDYNFLSCDVAPLEVMAQDGNLWPSLLPGDVDSFYFHFGTGSLTHLDSSARQNNCWT